MVRVTISRRDTADTAITVEVSSLHVQSFPLSPGTEVGSGIQDTFLWVYIFRQQLPFVVEGSTVPVVMSAAQVSRVGEKKYAQTAFDHQQYHTCVARSKESDFSNINPVNVRIREGYEDMNYTVE